MNLRQIAETFGARVFAMIGPFAVGIISARALGPEDRGKYFLVLSLGLIAAQIGNLGLQSSNTYLAASRRELVRPLLANGFYIALVVPTLAACVLAIVLGWPELVGLPSPAAGSVGPLTLMAVLIAPVSVMSLYVTNLAVGVGRVSLFNGLTIAYSLLAVAAAILVAVVGGGVAWFLVGALVSILLVVLFGASRMLDGRMPSLSFDAPLFRQGLGFAMRAYMATLFTFLLQRVGIIALQQQADFAELGQLSVATQIAEGLAMLPSTIALLLFPELVRADPGARWRSMWRTFWLLGLVMIPLLGAVGLLAPWIVPLLFGAEFSRSVVVLQTFLPSILLVSMITVLSQFLAAGGFPVMQVVAWLVGFVIQAALSFWLAGTWGAVGIAVALAISYAVVFAILLVETFSAPRHGGQAE